MSLGEEELNVSNSLLIFCTVQASIDHQVGSKLDSLINVLKTKYYLYMNNKGV